MIAFEVYGTPRPQGSMRAFIPKGGTRPVVISDNTKLKPWRQAIAAEALALNPLKMHGPVAVQLDFYFERPKSDPYRANHTVKPDLDKLIRGCLDAIVGIIINDDAQVVAVKASKRYDSAPAHVFIAVEPVREKASA